MRNINSFYDFCCTLHVEFFFRIEIKPFIGDFNEYNFLTHKIILSVLGVARRILILNFKGMFRKHHTEQNLQIRFFRANAISAGNFEVPNLHG